MYNHIICQVRFAKGGVEKYAKTPNSMSWALPKNYFALGLRLESALPATVFADLLKRPSRKIRLAVEATLLVVRTELRLAIIASSFHVLF